MSSCCEFLLFNFLMCLEIKAQSLFHLFLSMFLSLLLDQVALKWLHDISTDQPKDTKLLARFYITFIL